MILDSLEQLADQDVDLTDDVYERFFESCTAASALMRHTDQHMRGRMLGQALELLLTKDVSEYLEWEIDNHQSAYAVEADMYKPFFLAIRDEKWVILTNLQGEPLLALDADSFLRAALFDPENFKPYTHCHRPVIVKNEPYSLGWVIRAIAHGKRTDSSGVVIDDVVLLWGKTPRIITGADILGRLLTGI